MDEVKVDEVTVCERHRKDLGDIEILAQSIEDIGLIHPIVITEDKKLVAGLRRLEAFKRLDRDIIPVHSVNIGNLLRGELDENVVRKDFTPSEAVAIGRTLEEQERVAAKERMVDAHASPGKFPELEKGRTRNKVSRAVGMSGKTYEKAKKVVEASKENPNDYSDLKEKMDEEGKVNAAYKEYKRRKREKKKIKQEKQNRETTPYITHSKWQDWIDGQPKCHLLVTDPPYITDVENIYQFVSEWLPPVLQKVRDNGRAFVFIGAYGKELHAYLDTVLSQNRLQLSNIMAWTFFNTLGPKPKQKYHQNWQAILHLRGPYSPAIRCDELKKRTAVQREHVRRPSYHKWQKPRALAKRLIRHSTQQGDIVLDPFAGSGTFLLSAASLGRVAHGCDIDPEAIDMAIERGCENGSAD